MKMKNKLIILILLIVSNITFAQIDSTQVVQLSDTERIIDKYSEKIANAFSEGVEKVAPVAEQGFQIAVRYCIAEGIVYMLPLFICLLFMIIATKEYQRITNILNSEKVPKNMNSQNGAYSEENSSFKLISSTIIFAITGFISMFTTYMGITRLIAPEWYAIKEIIKMFN